MKTMYLPGYHQNGFVVTHALGYMMYSNSAVHRVPKRMSCHKVIVVITKDIFMKEFFCVADPVYKTSK